MSATADIALPQQDISAPPDAPSDPTGLSELGQRFLQKLQRRNQEELGDPRQLYADVRVMKDRDICSQKDAVYKDTATMFAFKDDVAEQSIPVVMGQKKKVRKNGSGRSDAYWQRVKRLNIRLQSRGQEHATEVDGVRKAIQRLTQDMERAVRCDLGNLIELSDGEADIVLKELDTEIEAMSPSEKHEDEQPLIIATATASPPPIPSPSPPAIELPRSSDLLPAPSPSTTEPTTSKPMESASSKPKERPRKRHLTGLRNLDIHEPPTKQPKWDCSGANYVAHEGDWKCSFCGFFNLDSYQTCCGRNEDETDCPKERDDEEIHSASILAGYEAWIQSDETQAAYALLKLAGGVRE